MNTKIDVQTLLGFLSATGLPVIFNAIIGFVHPSIYTLTCGVAWFDAAPACYADQRAEALLWIALSGIAVAFGGITMWSRLSKNPTPPAGTGPAIIPAGQIPVTVDQDGAAGLSTAKAKPGTVQETVAIAQPIAPPTTSPPA